MVLTKNSYTRITLALDIVRKIPAGPLQGYHELGTVKHQIDLCDRVSVEDSTVDLLDCDDPMVPSDDRNVCLKMAQEVRRSFGIDRKVRISLEKRIPVQGGLAGGSADAATTLCLLNELWGLGLTAPKLMVLGRKVGMDVPYYFVGGTAFYSEAGLRLEPVATECVFVFLLAIPEFGVSTKEAYSGIDYSAIGRRHDLTVKLLEALAVNDRESALGALHNDFEPSVFPRFPRLAAIKRELIEAGCSVAFMTGSGSTVVGVAHDRAHAEAIRGNISCRTIVAETMRQDRNG
jgi:4-diphosphocytidyl-2-C-methyl-D-erythritol kinase